jgi:hypothetical protein
MRLLQCVYSDDLVMHFLLVISFGKVENNNKILTILFHLVETACQMQQLYVAHIISYLHSFLGPDMNNLIIHPI